jgi:hypothetical protein
MAEIMPEIVPQMNEIITIIIFSALVISPIAIIPPNNIPIILPYEIIELTRKFGKDFPCGAKSNNKKALRGIDNREIRNNTARIAGPIIFK